MTDDVRAFLDTALRWCREQGIRQVLDLGAGVPAAGGVTVVPAGPGAPDAVLASPGLDLARPLALVLTVPPDAEPRDLTERLAHYRAVLVPGSAVVVVHPGPGLRTVLAGLEVVEPVGAHGVIGRVPDAEDPSAEVPGA